MFITSDLHLGHRLVSGLRGFGDDTDAHDEAVLAALRTVPSGQHLWILGDLTSGSSGKERLALDLLGDLRQDTGVIMHLVCGNHDSASPIHRDSWRHQRDFMKVFDSVQHVARRRWNGRTVWLSHFPWYGTRDVHAKVDRAQDLRVHDDGESWLVHGHQHLDHVVSGERSVDCGLDAAGMKVWAWNDLMDVLEQNQSE